MSACTTSGVLVEIDFRALKYETFGKERVERKMCLQKSSVEHLAGPMPNEWKSDHYFFKFELLVVLGLSRIGS